MKQIGSVFWGVLLALVAFSLALVMLNNYQHAQARKHVRDAQVEYWSTH